MWKRSKHMFICIPRAGKSPVCCCLVIDDNVRSFSNVNTMSRHIRNRSSEHRTMCSSSNFVSSRCLRFVSWKFICGASDSVASCEFIDFFLLLIFVHSQFHRNWNVNPFVYLLHVQDVCLCFCSRATGIVFVGSGTRCWPHDSYSVIIVWNNKCIQTRGRHRHTRKEEEKEKWKQQFAQSQSHKFWPGRSQCGSDFVCFFPSFRNYYKSSSCSFLSFCRSLDRLVIHSCSPSFSSPTWVHLQPSEHSEYTKKGKQKIDPKEQQLYWNLFASTASITHIQSSTETEKKRKITSMFSPFFVFSQCSIDNHNRSQITSFCLLLIPINVRIQFFRFLCIRKSIYVRMNVDNLQCFGIQHRKLATEKMSRMQNLKWRKEMFETYKIVNNSMLTI